jgi:subtilisin family serine protease
MAVPHVVGTAALYLEQHPGADPKTVADALYESATPGVIKDKRMKSGTANRMLYTRVLQGDLDSVSSVSEGLGNDVDVLRQMEGTG